MGYAWKNIDNGGGFKNVETGAYFEYERGPINDWAADAGALHTIFLIDDNVRSAIVKKTVAYVIIDEDENCQPVWEKWQIRHKFIREDGRLIFG